MRDENEQHDKEKLVHGYNRMLERVRSAIEGTEKEARPLVSHVIGRAKEKAVELGELTREEAEKVGHYLRRDLEDAGEYLSSDRAEEFMDWLRLDVQLVEQRLLELMTSVADKTKVELIELQRQAERTPEYHTGEVAGIGTLVCASCGQPVHFHATGHVPPCPKCHGTVFVRAGREDEA
jgi:hypothetical protein